MRTIIEIDDKDYEALNKVGHNGIEFNDTLEGRVYRAIANGTPVSTDGDCISRSALKKAIEEVEGNYDGYEPNDLGRFMNKVDDLIDNAPAVDERPQGEYVNISKLRLMTVEECAGHTIDYAMGWKACVEWIKKGGAE